MSANVERVPVVTDFVCSGGKVLLIRRSEKVSTYRGLWAGISGYVERIPLNQAYQELLEETGISEDQVRLRGIGVPLPVDDEPSGHHWLVFPFLFEMPDKVSIEPNWEASEYEWVEPDEIPRMKTVPGLRAAFDRVTPAIGDDEFWHGLSFVATDTEHGATHLAREGLETLGGYVQQNYENLDRHILRQSVRAFGSCRPGMGVFPDLAARLLMGMEREGGQDDFDALVTEMLEMIEDTSDLCVNEAAKMLHDRKRLFTLSFSETVADTILTWHHSDSEVLVAESGPRYEGRALAEYLDQHGVKATLVADGNIAEAVRDSDCVLVGCDGITGDAEIVNKIGTRVAVEAATLIGIPAYAVAQTFKIMPPDWPTFIEPQSPGDWDERVAEVVGTPVFDLTPFSMFDGVITEDGMLTVERLTGVQTDLASVELIPGT